MSDTYLLIPTDFRLHPNKVALSAAAELLYRRILEMWAAMAQYEQEGWMHENVLQYTCHRDSLPRVRELLTELTHNELVEVRGCCFRATHWDLYRPLAYNGYGDLEECLPCPSLPSVRSVAPDATPPAVG